MPGLILAYISFLIVGACLVGWALRKLGQNDPR
ncbi:hypothetical protein Ql52_gp005 [Caulobacter phage Quill_5.2]|uniref:Uncharacterized protein n=1 Tax=Caulobacter phage Quill_5.2 TaxID=3075108 RepID=A0AA96PXZ3_9CAUD|nr:hypothetical protein Ql52_gp005 [Caulobacter phage Quill_5.2]